MKKSKTITLILISAALASCHTKGPSHRWADGERHVYLRSDTSAPYTAMRAHGGESGLDHYYWAFRPYGDYYMGSYTHAGYYSDAVSVHSNYVAGSAKSSVARGGFGSGHSSVSS